MGVFTTTKTYRLGLNLMPQWWLSGASIDLDFDQQRYYDSSLATGVQSLAPLNSYLSCSRASTGYAKTSSGTLTSFGNDTLRITDLGLLVEDARTNRIPYSVDFASNWTNANATATNNQTASPDGTTTAAKLVEDTAISIPHEVVKNTGPGTAAATTASIYAKAGSGSHSSWLALALYIDATTPPSYTALFDLTNGTVVTTRSLNSPTSPSNSIETLANGWYRCSVTFTAPDASNAYVYAAISNSPTPAWGGNPERPMYAGDGSSFIYLWGGQLEAGAFASSYIPTAGASATRAADSITVSGALNTILSGSAASAIVDVTSPAAQDIAVLSAVSQNPIMSEAASLNTFVSSNSPSLDASIGNSLTWTTGAKMGLAWSGSGRSIVGGGGTVATDATNIVGARTSSIRLANSATGYNPGFLTCRRWTAWNSKLADATLQSLTAP